MNKIASGLMAATLAASFAAASAMPANAAPLYVPQNRAVSGDVQTVASRGGHHRIYRHNGGRYRHDGGRYWHGHRGYDHWRPGYRRYGDYWFPLAAFATGALITGAIVNDSPPAYRGGSAHTRWCYDRYRSYRAYDNTYQPYNGPRRQCVSPY